MDGEARAEHQYPTRDGQVPTAWVELARRTSPPLLDDLKITAKVSQNLHAEMALRAVGLASRDRGSERLPRLRRHPAGRLFARRWIRPGAVQPGDARHRRRDAAIYVRFAVARCLARPAAVGR